MFSHPLCLILYSHISIAACLAIPHICFHPYLPCPASFRISFVIPIISNLFHISASSVLTAPRAILIHRVCHLVRTIPLSSSTCFSPVLLMLRRLHCPASLPPPSLLFYISSASMVSLSILSHTSSTVAFPSYVVPTPLLRPALPLLLHASTKDLRHCVTVGQAFAFQSEGRPRYSSQATGSTIICHPCIH